MGKNILNQKEIRESYFFKCERCGKEVFGDFTVEDKPKLCDACRRLDELTRNIEKERK